MKTQLSKYYIVKCTINSPYQSTSGLFFASTNVTAHGFSIDKNVAEHYTTLKNAKRAINRCKLKMSVDNYFYLTDIEVIEIDEVTNNFKIIVI